MNTPDALNGFQIPANLGVAADLVFSVPDQVGYLADCLLVHDAVVIPLNAHVLNRLEAAFDTEPLRLLVKEKRIRFCPSYSYEQLHEARPYDREEFFEFIREQDFYKTEADRSSFFAEIEATFVDPISSDYSPWLSVREQVDLAFSQYENRKGYEFLFPSERYYYRTGAITGVARMNDLLRAGIPSMEMDEELPQLLELCFPLLNAGGVSAEADHLAAKRVLEELHKITNLPTFGRPGFPGAVRSKDEIDSVVKIVLSDEAHDLRTWLAKNLTADLDVRAAYDAAEKLLPSKREWTNWVRFGLSTGASTVAGLLLAGPLGAAIGTAIGAADVAVGKKATSLFDDYHPKIWLSHVQRSGLLKKPQTL